MLRRIPLDVAPNPSSTYRHVEQPRAHDLISCTNIKERITMRRSSAAAAELFPLSSSSRARPKILPRLTWTLQMLLLIQLLCLAPCWRPKTAAAAAATAEAAAVAATCFVSRELLFCEPTMELPAEFFTELDIQYLRRASAHKIFLKFVRYYTACHILFTQKEHRVF